MMRVFIFLICLLINQSAFSARKLGPTYEPAYQLTSIWLKEISPTNSALEEFQKNQLAGLTIDGDHFFLPSPLGLVEKRENKTGTAIWSTQLDGASQAGWTLYQGELFGGDTKGTIYCLNALTGKIKWRAQTKGVFFSKPLVRDEQVWIMSSLGTLQAYERETGRFLWQQTDPNNSATALWSFQGPVFFEGLVIAGFPSAILQAFEPVSGKAVWNESFQNSISSAESFNDLKAVSVNDHLLMASSYNGELRIWEAFQKSKKLVWQKKLALYSPMTLDADGALYASARDGSIQALDSKTGFLKWQYQLTSGLGSQVAVTRTKLWVGSSSGEVYVLSKDGKLIAKSNDYQSPIWNAPQPLNDDEALVLTARANLRRIHIAKVR